MSGQPSTSTNSSGSGFGVDNTTTVGGGFGSNTNSTGFGGSGNDTSSGGYDSWDPSKFDWVPIMASHTDAKRLAAAFLTWVIYDYAITVDDSINLFWAYRWSISKAMYLISRYVSLYTVAAIAAQIFVQNPSPDVSTLLRHVMDGALTCRASLQSSLKYCNAAPWMQFTGSAILIIVINLALITRVYALWNRDIRILIFSLLGFSLNIGSYIIILSYAYAKGFFFANIPPFTGCNGWPGYDKTYIIFVTSVSFETMIVILTVYKSWSVAVQKGIKTPLYTLILEDGIVYFFIIILSQILTAVAIWAPSVVSGPVIGSYPSIAVSGIACNRLFIRLQRLLLNSRGQANFHTEDFNYTTSSPRTSYGGGALTKNISPSPEGEQQPHRRSPSNRLSKHRRNSTTLGEGSGDIVMEKVSRASMQNAAAERSHQNRSRGSGRSGSLELDREIDLSGHYQAIAAADEAVRKGHEMLDAQRPASQRTDQPPPEMEMSHPPEDEGPFTYGSGKSVLDPSPRFAGELSNRPPGDDSIGRLVVSRVGRYD